MTPASLPVAAVVVNFNAGVHLLHCVRSLRAAGVDDVVVVDNDSHDGSVDALAASEPWVQVVRTGANLGFGRGVNRGVATLGELPPAIAVVNPDVVVEPGTLKTLVDVLDGEAGVAIVGPRIDNPDGTRYPSARHFPSLVDAAGHAALSLVWPGNPFTRRYRRADWSPREAADVDWVSGACFLVRREAWEALGGFDERYFMYMEDVDLSWRVWRLGWRVHHEPAASVVHIQGVSADQSPYRMIVAHHRSMLRFAAGSTTGPSRLLLPVVAVGVVLRAVVACGHRRLVGRRVGR